ERQIVRRNRASKRQILSERSEREKGKKDIQTKREKERRETKRKFSYLYGRYDQLALLDDLKAGAAAMEMRMERAQQFTEHRESRQKRARERRDRDQIW